jgi:hypothetical protein
MRARSFFSCCLLALQVTTVAVAQSPAQPTRFSGEWVSSYGLTAISFLTLKQKGNAISGSYELIGHKCDQAAIRGVVKGTRAKLSAVSSYSSPRNALERTGKATLGLSGDKLIWTMTASPSVANYLPDSMVFVRKRPGTGNSTWVDLALVEQGRFCGEEDKPPYTSYHKLPWFGVFQEADHNFVMKKCTIKQLPEGAYVKPDNAIFVVRGLKTFSPGPIQWARIINKRPTRSTPVIMAAGGRKYTLKLKSIDGGTNEVLSDGSNEQIIVELLEDDANAPEVIWAGDLDRDGRLDFLIDAGEQAGWMVPPSLVLLLSSANAEVAGTAGICSSNKSAGESL